MFADLKNDYKDISTAEYSKWIENWLVTLADLVEEESNFDDTLMKLMSISQKCVENLINLLSMTLII